jgi:large-conductance mechanosensitive channel
MMIKGISKLQKKEEEKPKPETKKSDEVLILEEIRDALKKQKD